MGTYCDVIFLQESGCTRIRKQGFSITDYWSVFFLLGLGIGEELPESHFEFHSIGNENVSL